MKPQATGKIGHPDYRVWIGACALALARHPENKYPQPKDIMDAEIVFTGCAVCGEIHGCGHSLGEYVGKPREATHRSPLFHLVTGAGREDWRTVKKTSETYYETIGTDCLTLEINLEVRPVMYKISGPSCWRTKKDWLIWLDICHDRIKKMP